MERKKKEWFFTKIVRMIKKERKNNEMSSQTEKDEKKRLKIFCEEVKNFYKEITETEENLPIAYKKLIKPNKYKEQIKKSEILQENGYSTKQNIDRLSMIYCGILRQLKETINMILKHRRKTKPTSDLLASFYKTVGPTKLEEFLSEPKKTHELVKEKLTLIKGGFNSVWNKKVRLRCKMLREAGKKMEKIGKAKIQIMKDNDELLKELQENPKYKSLEKNTETLSEFLENENKSYYLYKNQNIDLKILYETIKKQKNEMEKIDENKTNKNNYPAITEKAEGVLRNFEQYKAEQEELSKNERKNRIEIRDTIKHIINLYKEYLKNTETEGLPKFLKETEEQYKIIEKQIRKYEEKRDFENYDRSLLKETTSKILKEIKITRDEINEASTKKFNKEKNSYDTGTHKVFIIVNERLVELVELEYILTVFEPEKNNKHTPHQFELELKKFLNTYHEELEQIKHPEKKQNQEEENIQEQERTQKKGEFEFEEHQYSKRLKQFQIEEKYEEKNKNTKESQPLLLSHQKKKEDEQNRNNKRKLNEKKKMEKEKIKDGIKEKENKEKEDHKKENDPNGNSSNQNLDDQIEKTGNEKNQKYEKKRNNKILEEQKKPQEKEKEKENLDEDHKNQIENKNQEVKQNKAEKDPSNNTERIRVRQYPPTKDYAYKKRKNKRKK